MVPRAGIEPARLLGRKILSLVCLPISPPRHIDMEAEVGIEPALTDLQSAALPLCHSAKLLS
jgi:hypothetical protein